MKKRMHPNLVILKSDIDNSKKYSIAKSALDSNSFIHDWSVDMEDIDKVLRIECSKDLTEVHTIQWMHSLNIQCEELV